MIVFDQVSFWYNDRSETSFKLKEVSFSLEKGCVNGVIGGNGSGKSTVARLMVGLMPVNSGCVRVLDKDPYQQLLHSGFLAGIIFQNPENQIVGATVEEDLAFGLENLGLSHAEMHCRIIETATRFGLGNMLTDWQPAHAAYSPDLVWGICCVSRLPICQAARNSCCVLLR